MHLCVCLTAFFIHIATILHLFPSCLPEGKETTGLKGDRTHSEKIWRINFDGLASPSNNHQFKIHEHSSNCACMFVHIWYMLQLHEMIAYSHKVRLQEVTAKIIKFAEYFHLPNSPSLMLCLPNFLAIQ